MRAFIAPEVSTYGAYESPLARLIAWLRGVLS